MEERRNFTDVQHLLQGRIFPYLYLLVAESGAYEGLTLRRVVLYGYSDDWVKGLEYIQASCVTMTRNQSKKKINTEISCLI